MLKSFLTYQNNPPNGKVALKDDKEQ